MKNLTGILVFIPVVFLIHSCKPDPKLTPPVLTSAQVTEITYTTATAGGELTDIGGAYVTARGVCWSTSVEPTISDYKTTESGGLGVFTSQLTGLTPNTMYYVRAYGTNSAGTAYGNEVSFKTLQIEVPVLTTTEITSITQTTASSGGNITDEKGGSVTARGICWSTHTNPTTSDNNTSDGAGTGSFNSSLTDLVPGTTYYVKAYATNSVGTAYGNEISFISLTTIPTVTTTAVSSIKQTNVVGGGNVTSDGGSTVNARGVCWSTSSNPSITDNHTTDGTGTGIFASSIIGLTPKTSYYLRSYATNSEGIVYGDVVPFTTQNFGTLTDIDGNVYKSIDIGTQTWMAENLKTTKYNDGTAIPLITDNTAWLVLTTPAYSWYNNDAGTYKETYGALYNWFAVDEVSNGGKNICPTGWHLSTDTEWIILTTYVGGVNNAGGKLKETGTSHWNAPNKDATNESGFTALPAGLRHDYSGEFLYIGMGGVWWSSTTGNPGNAYRWDTYYERADVGYNGDIPLQKRGGFSVRCVKNN